jgi:hypothetical protein
MIVIFWKELRVDKLEGVIGTVLLRVFCLPVYCLITETFKKPVIMCPLIGFYWCEYRSLSLNEEHTILMLDLRCSQRWL